jgi:uncharacterized protein YecE (DUF72 family)
VHDNVYVGTCGFSYRDWVGVFYPSGLPQAKMLAFYARTFSCVEIDSTYYAVPKPEVFARMAERTPERFRFSVKAPGAVTHLPADVGALPEHAGLFRDAVAPLAAAGKLASILLQFPTAFHPGPQAFARIGVLAEAFAGLPLVAEFRRRDWQSEETLDVLRSHGIGYVNVDEPALDALPRLSAEATSPVATVRFHGRNAAMWWRGDNTTRYDYSYTDEELVPWVIRAGELVHAPRVREVMLFFNNHRRGQAVANACTFRRLLDLARGD